MEELMHRWFVAPPVRMMGSIVGILAWISLLSVCWYLPFWFQHATFGWLLEPVSSAPWSFPWISVFGALLIGSIPLILWWVRGQGPLHRVTLVLSSAILVVYVAFILWPAYDSGIDWSMGYPNRVGEGPFYTPWYEVLMEWGPGPFAWVLYFTLLGSFLAAWYILMPLGLLTLGLLRQRWPHLNPQERWVSISLSLLTIVVPAVTWTRSHKFLVWLFE
jgi:hypothetical protein